ncbi:hypothetical protein HanIR_Chr13g0634711 [Helianthus annuus]|nr:hypothetical protein HanIR_Chr13g0634711 [Helianthus annuus]
MFLDWGEEGHRSEAEIQSLRAASHKKWWGGINLTILTSLSL